MSGPSSSNAKGDELDVHDSYAKLEVPQVTWYKDSGLRKLYMLMPVFFLGSTNTGYDGSLLDGLQTMVPWQSCMISS